jgi:hypothetical protein
VDVAALDAAHPPDTPLRLLGTTPWGLLRAARALGLDARYRWGRADPDLLCRHLADAGPAIVLLDVGARLPTMHWAVAHAADAEGVSLVGLHPAPREATWPWPRFLRAWRGLPLPGYRHGALLANPSSER